MWDEMTQSIVQLPETAYIRYRGDYLKIENHRVLHLGGLFGMIDHIVNRLESDRDTLSELEQHNISFEAAIECCITELEDNPDILADFIFWGYKIESLRNRGVRNANRNEIIVFAGTPAGRDIVGDITDKIRDCNNWADLYDMIEPGSDFNKNIRQKIRAIIKQ